MATRSSQPLGGKRVDVRRRDRAAVAPELTEAGLVQHDREDVLRALSACGHAGVDSSVVRPTTPENSLPGSYSLADS